MCTLIWYLGLVCFVVVGFFGAFFSLLSWMFQHAYLDTCCSECLIIMHVFVSFVFAPVQHN